MFYQNFKHWLQLPLLVHCTTAAEGKEGVQTGGAVMAAYQPIGKYQPQSLAEDPQPGSNGKQMIVGREEIHGTCS